ncbi:hypothetical protein [Demetria terragena]|uniref:hypothetical protein n=1 Tax=Demetria terragena TaxID=63959 RepID=UPI000375E8B2|nr:hypothetical protein [Demetria terragena]
MTVTHHFTSDESRRPVARRAIVQGAAWSVPVIALATAAPAHAASTANLAVTATNCSLVNVAVLSANQPGFTYTATEGTVPAGTEITISTGGTAAVNVGNFVFPGATLSVASIGGTTATFRTSRALNGGESFTIGLTGLSVNGIGTYTTRIVTPDTIQTDDIAIMSAGGVGVGTAVGAFVCFDPQAGTVAPVPDLAMDVQIDFGWCQTVGLSLTNRPSFQIRVTGGTIPAGTQFLLYSTSALSVGTGSWTAGGSNLGLSLLGSGGQAAQFTTPRAISPTTPLTIQREGALDIGVNSTYYLAYLGNDTAPANNARGMTVTGVRLGLVTVASCQRITG